MDLQAQARAHRIGQKRDVLVLRFETVLPRSMSDLYHSFSLPGYFFVACLGQFEPQDSDISSLLVDR